MVHGHVAGELARADPHEGHFVAVARVHVALDLENKAGEGGEIRADGAHGRVARARRGGMLHEAVQHKLDAEIVDRAAEEHRRGLARQHLFRRIFRAGQVQHAHFFDKIPVADRLHLVLDVAVVYVADLHRGPESAAGGALEHMRLLREAVVDAAEILAAAHRPVHRERLQAQHFFQLVYQFERLAGRAVHLVHESENRDVAAAADLEQFQRLGLYALARVYHHDGRVHGGQHAVGVLGKVAVARRVQQVDAVAVIVELQHGGTDGDAALFFQLHPVRGRGALVLAGRDGARQVQGAAVKQQLLGKRGLAGVGVGNYGEGAPAGGLIHGVPYIIGNRRQRKAPGPARPAAKPFIPAILNLSRRRCR